MIVHIRLLLSLAFATLVLPRITLASVYGKYRLTSVRDASGIIVPMKKGKVYPLKVTPEAGGGEYDCDLSYRVCNNFWTDASSTTGDMGPTGRTKRGCPTRTEQNVENHIYVIVDDAPTMVVSGSTLKIVSSQGTMKFTKVA